jgi:hypothetical protein
LALSKSRICETGRYIRSRRHACARHRAAPSAVGPLGPKWTHNWQYSFVFLNSTTLSIRVPGGGSYVFFQTGGLPNWLPTAGADAPLTNAGSTYTLTTTSQLVYTFALVSGATRLQSLTDRNGNTISSPTTGPAT